MDIQYEDRSVPALNYEELDDFEYELEGCDCQEGQCHASTGCKCLNFGADNYNEEGQLLHDEDSNLPIMECHPNCSCAEDCGNRAAQFGLQVKVETFHTNDKGLGLRALEPIKKGKFVIEYSGEIVSHAEAAKRAKQRFTEDPNQHNYIFTLNEFSGNNATPHQTFIDATHVGNLSRLINHSCAPNLHPMILRYGRVLPVLALFAQQDIEVGEELAYDYGKIADQATNSADSETKMKECKCGAVECRKFLPSYDYNVQ